MVQTLLELTGSKRGGERSHNHERSVAVEWCVGMVAQLVRIGFSTEHACQDSAQHAFRFLS